MKHEILCRNDEVPQRYKSFKDKQGKRYNIGMETFSLHKLGGSVMDMNTGYRWDDESDIIDIVHTDANGEQIIDSKDVKEYNTTVKEVVEDIKFILSCCDYWVKNNIEVFSGR